MNQAGKVAASVRQRLKNVAAISFEDFQAILTRYALERFGGRIAANTRHQHWLVEVGFLDRVFE